VVLGYERRVWWWLGRRFSGTLRPATSYLLPSVPCFWSSQTRARAHYYLGTLTVCMQRNHGILPAKSLAGAKRQLHPYSSYSYTVLVASFELKISVGHSSNLPSFSPRSPRIHVKVFLHHPVSVCCTSSPAETVTYLAKECGYHGPVCKFPSCQCFQSCSGGFFLLKLDKYLAYAWILPCASWSWHFDFQDASKLFTLLLDVFADFCLN
jgi:hypothetical protein